jgi:hypothetical protein
VTRGDQTGTRRRMMLGVRPVFGSLFFKLLFF